MHETLQARVRLGPFEVDLQAGELRRGKRRVLLPEQPLQVLRMLVEGGGRIVTREEMQKTLWPNDTIVEFDHSINVAVNRLRRVFGDSAEEPHYIETLASRGYRLIIPVEPAAPQGPLVATKAPISIRDVELAQPNRGSSRVAQADAPNRGATERWIWISVISIAVLAAGGWFYWQARDTATLTNQDTIVLADFSNRTSDPVLDAALNTALRTELEQTPFLNLLSSDKVRGTLQQMGRAEDSKLPLEQARVICLQTNSKAVVAGSITDVGNRYLLELKAAGCRSGRVLATTKLGVGSRSEIVKMLGVAGTDLRRRLGEPNQSLLQFNKPLDRATSPSLEALQVYAEGVRQEIRHVDAAIPYFKQATELDPNFADAYGWLGAVYYRPDEAALATAALTRAYELRDRLTKRDQFPADHMYYREVTGEVDKANAAYEEWIRTFPLDRDPYIGLSVTYATLGQHERSIAVAREAIRLAPGLDAYNNLMNGEMFLGRLDEAKKVYDEAESHGYDDVLLRGNRYQVAFLQNDSVGMQEQVSWAAGKPGEDGIVWLQSQTEAYHGRLRNAHGHALRAIALARRDDPPNSGADDESGEAWRDAEAGAARAAKEARAALAKTSDRNIRLKLALALARAGDVVQAQKIVDAVAAEYPRFTVIQNYHLPTIRAAIALSKNDAARSIEVLRPVVPYEFASTESFDALEPAYLRGLAYLQLGRGQQAASEFHKLLDHSGVVNVSITGALAHLQLGRAQAMMGDNVAARRSYQEFLMLWKEADPDIPIYIQAKAECAKLQLGEKERQ